MARNSYLPLIVILAVLLVAVYLASSVSFTTSPSITPSGASRPDTTDNLVCSWDASADTTAQNISWYNGTELYRTDTGVNGSSLILATVTTRGENWNCTVTLSNGTNTAIMSTNVTIKNAAPSTPIMTNSTAADIGNTTVVYEDTLNSFTLSATDPDSDTVTYGTLTSVPTGASLNSNNGAFTWTPTASSTNANVTFYATDTFGSNPGITTLRVEFTVQQVNDAPVFSVSSRSITEGSVFNYPVSATDEESNTPLTFNVSASPSLDVVATSTGSTSATLMLSGNRTATFLEAGNYTITVNVTDSLGARTQTNFTLSINQTNVAPVLATVPNATGTQGSSFLLNITATDTDSNDTLNFNVTTTGCSNNGLWNITQINTSSNGSAVINVSSLSNSHVVCRQLFITVIDDDGAEDSQDVFLNISNTNDPPIVEVLSFFSNNTDNQHNISSLHGYAESPFTYLVNSSDIDSLTYEGEVLSYSDNSSIFAINASTGLVSFTPSQSDVGNHSIEITVTDDQGLSDTEVLNLEVRNNSAPVLSNIGNITCLEDSSCYAFISASDGDEGNLSFSSDSATFSITTNTSVNPIRSAYMLMTPTQNQVGNYTITVTVTDFTSASDAETFNFEIANVNDAPVLTAFTLPTIVEGHQILVTLSATDEDYDLANSYENLTFSSTNLSGRDLINVTTQWNSQTNRTYGQIYFVPQTGDAGDYSFNVTVTDEAGAYDYEIKNFTILARSDPPTLGNITPYGKPVTNETVFSFIPASNFSTPLTTINFTENRSVTYNATATDDLTSVANLNYTWLVDGSEVSTSRAYTVSYGYFSQGTYNITVIIKDDMYENATFTWNLTIHDVNRAPLLINNLESLTVNRTETYVNYFKNSPVTHFLDPDDDNNSNQQFDSGEDSTLTYTHNSCDFATLEVDVDSLRIIPTSIGACTVFFTANDTAGLSVISNGVVINVTDVPPAEEVEVPVSSGGGGGGGGGGSSSVITPTRREEVKPVAIELLVPEVVTTYDKFTALVPITVQNTWNSSLQGINLSAITNSDDDVKLEFSQSYIEELLVGQKVNVSLYVSNYRLGESYRINITANVTDPKTSDTAYVFLNSIEQSQEGEDVQIKVTFAQDLLSQNPECLELYELLGRAQVELAGGDSEKANKMIDAVVDGCKYLVSVAKRTEQKPAQTMINKILNGEYSRVVTVAGVTAAAIVIGLLGYRYRPRKPAIVSSDASTAH